MNIEKIGDFIRDKRKAMNLTQGELADIIQVSHQAVSRWENGENLPDVQKLSELAILFRVTIDEIVNAGNIEINETRPKSNLSFLSMINKVITVVSLVLYFVLLYSTGVYWIPFLVLFILIIGFAMLYVIPFNALKDKTQEDFKCVRSSIMVNAGAIVTSLMSLVTFYSDNTFIIWVLSLLFVLIVLIYPIHFLLKIYEINHYTDDHINLVMMIKRDKYIIPFIRTLVIFLVAAGLTLAIRYGIDILWPELAHIESLYIFQISFAVVLLGSLVPIIILRNQFNFLNIILMALFISTIANWIFILTFVDELYFFNSLEYSNRIGTMNLIYDINGYLLLSILAFAIFFFVKFKSRFISGMRLTLYLLIISILMMFMIDFAYYFDYAGTFNLGGIFCFDENMVFYYIGLLFVVLFMGDWLIFTKHKTKALD